MLSEEEMLSRDPQRRCGDAHFAFVETGNRTPFAIGMSLREAETFRTSTPEISRLGVHLIDIELLNIEAETEIFLELRVENQTKRTGPIVRPLLFGHVNSRVDSAQMVIGQRCSCSTCCRCRRRR